MNSCHPNKGIDYHLKALGFHNRKDWEVLASDDKKYATEYMICQPDWLLHNRRESYYLNIEYKNRDLGKRGATLYEMYQSTINQIIIWDHLYRENGRMPRVKGVLLYGNSRKMEVSYTAKDYDRIFESMLELVPNPSDFPIAATELAKLLSGADFTGVPVEKIKQGRAAHQAMVGLGPKRRAA